MMLYFYIVTYFAFAAKLDDRLAAHDECGAVTFSTLYLS